jgi:gluconate 2-dehydrogenase gamma chain
VPRDNPLLHGPLSRRALLAGAGAGAAAIGLGGLAACGEDEPREDVPPADTDASAFPPLPPSTAPASCSIRSFFTAEEAATVEAFTARLIPGDAADPGAREACVTTYIDQKLARFETFATPTYFQPPFAAAVKPGQPAPQGTIGVPANALPRYGFQSSLTPQKAYRQGLAALDRVARRDHGTPFRELGEDEQDELLTRLEAGKVDGFDEPKADAFFAMLQDDANEGMFADPVYGGNRGYAGWRLIGYPGAQRAYTPDEVQHGPRNRRVQGLRDMPSTHPGRSGGGRQPMAHGER